jgi:hypothetical protein
MQAKKMVPAILLMTVSCSITAFSQEPAKSQAPPKTQEAAKTPEPAKTPKKFMVCENEYALCTFSQCGEEQKHEGKPSTVACACSVQHDYSVGTECEGPKTNRTGQTIVRSRYHPIDGYARCTNDKPWAMCLDSPCVIDSNDPNKATKASCTCSVQKNQGDYLVPTACTTGIISSATVLDLDKITDFMETSDKIPSVPDLKVINPKQPTPKQQSSKQ